MDLLKEFHKIMEEQSDIALATSVNDIPKESEEFARTNCGIVKKSDLPMSDFKQVICEKVPGYKEIIDNFEEKLVLYEISFKEVAITINYDEYKIVL